GEVNHGFRYISQALDLERFTMFTFSPIKQRLDLLTDWVQTAERDGEPVGSDPRVRARLANLHTEAEVARVLGLKFVAEAVKVEQAVREGKEGFQPPTVAASEYKLYATELSKRLADASMDIAGPGSQLRVHTEDAPMKGRADSTYRFTVIDTIGGGASEIQKNIIARRGLGLPKNF
ncbi:MAG: acyl-CoA dehydrogenase, partial [Caldilineaceae bacterium SB0668_bin_21]|nr:acyl-CoA dehydrogenase [Caldilineaceae bacterium SB0668_bin_21]